MEMLTDFIKGKIEQLLDSSFAKGVLIISGGSVMTQIVSFIFSPLITRIFPPEEYGVMSLFASIVAILSIVSSLKYEMALPIVKDDKKAKNLFVLCLITLTFYTIILSLIFFITDDTLLNLLNAQPLSSYKLLLVFGVFLYGLREIYMQWFYRKKDFSLISKSRTIQSLVGNISKVVFGILGFGPIGLIIGQILKETFSILPFSLKVHAEEEMTKEISLQDIRWNVKRFKNNPLYLTPSSFLSIFKNQLPVFSLAFYGSSIVGLYGLANTVVKIPMTLLGHSIRNVFFTEAASIGKENPQKIKELSNNIFRKLIVLGMIPLIILLLLGPFLFSLVFGSEWTEAGYFSRYLALSVFADFIFSPVSRVYEILEKQKAKLFIDIFGLVIVLLSFTIARIISSDPNVAIFLYSMAMFIYYLAIFVVSRILIDVEITNQQKGVSNGE